MTIYIHKDTVINYLINKFNVLTGFRFWFEIQIQYKKDITTFFTASRLLGFSYPDDIFKRREIVKLFFACENISVLNTILSLPKNLQNGHFDYSITSKIGYLKKDISNP